VLLGEGSLSALKKELGFLDEWCLLRPPLEKLIGKKPEIVSLYLMLRFGATRDGSHRQHGSG